jgi:hypothetical protein
MIRKKRSRNTGALEDGENLTYFDSSGRIFSFAELDWWWLLQSF